MNLLTRYLSNYVFPGYLISTEKEGNEGIFMNFISYYLHGIAIATHSVFIEKLLMNHLKLLIILKINLDLRKHSGHKYNIVTMDITY